AHDEELIALHLHRLARVLAEQHAIADLDVDRNQLAVLVFLALAYRDDLALVGLLRSGVRNDDAPGGLAFLFNALDDHAVVQRTNFHAGSQIEKTNVFKWVLMLPTLEFHKPSPVSTQLGRVLIIASTLLAFKPAAQDLPQPVREALRTAGVPAANVSAWVQEVGAARPSVAARAGTPMHPASVMKLVTTYAALELLGPAYRWKTEAYVDGEDLYLRGYGDPNLNYESFWLL